MGVQFYWENLDPDSRWTGTHIYRAPAKDGMYSLIRTVDRNLTTFDDPTGLTSYYYRLAFWDAKNGIEGDLSDPFSPATLPPLSVQVVRNYVGLNPSDPPDNTVLSELIVNANTELIVDNPGLGTSNYRLALKLLAGAYVCDWIARYLTRGGSLNFSIDGVSVQVPAGVWQMESKDQREKYNTFMWKFATETYATAPLTNAGYGAYAQDITEIMQSITNAREHQRIPTLYRDDEVAVLPG